MRSRAAATKAARILRGLLWTLRILAGGGRGGAWLEVERGATLRHGAHRGLRFGRGVYVGRGVVIDVPRGAVLDVGDGCKLMHYVVIASAERIVIGRLTQVAEHCSVRDADHGIRAGTAVQHQPLVTTPVWIGDDVWLGAGVRVLRGAWIGDGCVIGANAVAKGRFPAGSVAVGVPARVVDHRVPPEGQRPGR